MPKPDDDAFEEERENYFDKITGVSEGPIESSRNSNYLPGIQGGRHPASVSGHRRLSKRERQMLRPHFLWPTVFFAVILVGLGIWAVIGILATQGP